MERDQIAEASRDDLEELQKRILEELQRRDTPEEKSGRDIVETREGKAGRWLRAEMVNCRNCRKCRDHDRRPHGPYLYLYYTNKRGTYTSEYHGKNQTPDLIEEFGEVDLSR